MKNIILGWKPTIGPDQELIVDIELGHQHPKRDLGANLAQLVVRSGSNSLKPFPGLTTLPEFSQRELNLIVSHAEAYRNAFFKITTETTIWVEDEDTNAAAQSRPQHKVSVVCSECEGRGVIVKNQGSDNMDVYEIPCDSCGGNGHLTAIAFRGVREEGYDMDDNEVFSV